MSPLLDKITRDSKFWCKKVFETLLQVIQHFFGVRNLIIRQLLSHFKSSEVLKIIFKQLNLKNMQIWNQILNVKGVVSGDC